MAYYPYKWLQHSIVSGMAYLRACGTPPQALAAHRRKHWRCIPANVDRMFLLTRLAYSQQRSWE